MNVCRDDINVRFDSMGNLLLGSIVNYSHPFSTEPESNMERGEKPLKVWGFFLLFGSKK